jgi:hypothetical protein
MSSVDSRAPRSVRIELARPFLPPDAGKVEVIRQYNAWRAVVNRCHREKDKDYTNYGGRGIFVCDRWQGDHGFANLMRDMGPWRAGYTLERIDVDGPYSPENCRWATWKEQQRNRRDNKLLTYNGKTQCLSAWAEETGVNKTTIRVRLLRGLSPEEALRPT